MSQQHKRIGDYCLVGDGAHASLKRVDLGVPYLTAKNLKAGTISSEKIDYIDEPTFEKHFKLDSKAISRPKSGDVIFGIIGSLGQAYLVKKSDLFGISSSVAVLRPDAKALLPKYLYYWVTGSTFQSALYAIKGGVAQSYISLEMIRSLPLVVPALPTQRRMASILSAYDDLIENNTRRIAILEEMARRIYEEWFVRFRFPGHEQVKMVESELGLIPEGWHVRPMSEVAEVIDCLHSKKPERAEEGTGLLLQLDNIGDGGKLDLSKKYLISDSDYQKWTSRMEAQTGDCVVTNVGRVGAVAQIPHGVRAALGRNMTGIRAKTPLMSPTYLIQYLLSSHMESETLKKKDAGTIMDSLNVKGIIRLAVPIAPTVIMEQFDQLVLPIRKMLEVLVSKNANLRATRDLLLPKLVSGQLDVSTLPEPEEAIAA